MIRSFYVLRNEKLVSYEPISTELTERRVSRHSTGTVVEASTTHCWYLHSSTPFLSKIAIGRAGLARCMYSSFYITNAVIFFPLLLLSLPQLQNTLLLCESAPLTTAAAATLRLSFSLTLFSSHLLCSRSLCSFSLYSLAALFLLLSLLAVFLYISAFLALVVLFSFLLFPFAVLSALSAMRAC